MHDKGINLHTGICPLGFCICHLSFEKKTKWYWRISFLGKQSNIMFVNANLSGIFWFVHTCAFWSERGIHIVLYNSASADSFVWFRPCFLYFSWLSIQCKCCTVVNHAVISFAIENHLLHRYYFFNICHMAFYDMSVSCAIC